MKFGIDVGGTTVKIGLIENQTIIDKYEIPTKKETLWKDICLSIQDYMQKNSIQNIEGLGFGLPGNVIQNYIYNLPNVGLQNVELEQEIKKYFYNVRIVSANDANVAALGEMMHHLDFQNACMITLGTGVGGGIVINGRVLEGSHGSAGEIGHMLIADDYNFPCSCGLCGCLETVASATGIVRLTKHHFTGYSTNLPKEFSAKDVFDLARQADPLCEFVVDRICYYLAKCISILAVTVDVDVYYIGGGVSKAGDILLSGIKKHYQQLSHFAVKKVHIEIAELLNDAGILGAACLID